MVLFYHSKIKSIITEIFPDKFYIMAYNYSIDKMADDETYREILKTTERMQKEIKVPSFWVVTNPTKDSTLADVVFETDLSGMMKQIGGGLRERDIARIYKNKRIATVMGHKLLHAQGIDGCPFGQKWNQKTNKCVKE